jgi:uncharacterized protein YqgQ
MSLFTLIYSLNEDIKTDSELKGLYDKFNRLYFDGRLPSIPVIFKSLKNVGGQAIASINSVTKVVTVKGIQISSFIERSDDYLQAILLHEMIHVDLYIQGVINTFGDRSGHGLEFKLKMRDVEQKSGIKIPLVDILSGNVSSNIKTKFFQVVLAYNKGSNTYYISVLRDGLINVEIFRAYSSRLEKGYDYYLIRSDDRELLKYPVRRLFKSTLFGKLDNISAERILKNSHILDVSKR